MGTPDVKVQLVCCFEYSMYKNVTKGAGAAWEDPTEGGQMASEKETPSLSKPSSGE